jgi:type IV secretion system protein VirB11
MNSLANNSNGSVQGGVGPMQGGQGGLMQRAELYGAVDVQQIFADAKIIAAPAAPAALAAPHRTLASITPYDKSVTIREKLKQSGLQHFLDLAGVTEVRVNQPGTIITESADGWARHSVPECDLRILKELANAAAIFNGGTALDINCPIKQVRLPDGQRGQIVIPPACQPDTVALTFRIPSSRRFTVNEYKQSGRLDKYRDVSIFREVPEGVHLQPFELELLTAREARDMVRFFELCIEYKLNICLSGGTGSGKTTFMKALADLVSIDTCIITIEDTHELDLPLHWNKVHLFYGDFVTPKQQLKNCMRMKPDRIFLTELRGDEAFDYIAALNTAHPGSLTTVHSNSPIEAYQRIATLIKQSDVGRSLDWNHLMREVTSSIDVVAQFSHTRMTQLYYDPVRKAKIMRGDKDV